MTFIKAMKPIMRYYLRNTCTLIIYPIANTPSYKSLFLGTTPPSLAPNRLTYNCYFSTTVLGNYFYFRLF